jgi:uncharacterized membrane protein YhaH (DUF805 family)
MLLVPCVVAQTLNNRSSAPGPRTRAWEGDKVNWYLEVLRKYAVFSGRSRRKEYWMFFLFNMIVVCVLTIIEALVRSGAQMSVLTSIYSLGVLIPGIAVAIRRLHDTNRSGWWLLICFVPLIGAIVLIVFMTLDSQPGDNQYGPNPKSAV